jgi:hypothetical protein
MAARCRGTLYALDIQTSEERAVRRAVAAATSETVNCDEFAKAPAWLNRPSLKEGPLR